EEVVQADLLLHIVDASHPRAEEQIEAVNDVLKEIGADGKPTLMVLNKTDQLNGHRDRMTRFTEKHPNAVAISATTGEGIRSLMAELGSQIRPLREFIELEVPHERTGVIARLAEVAQVIERNYRIRPPVFNAAIA